MIINARADTAPDLKLIREDARANIPRLINNYAALTNDKVVLKAADLALQSKGLRAGEISSPWLII